jgi:hypothetical protein
MLNQKYVVSTFKNKKFSQKRVTLEEAEKIRPDDVDIQINETNGQNSFKPPNGKSEELSELGPCLWRMLLDILWATGSWIELGSINYMNARVLRLRRKFGDLGTYFFITRKNPTYAIRWNYTERSWRFIEKLAENKTDK